MIEGEFALAIKDVKKLRNEHRANPHRHQWTPMETGSFGNEGRVYQMKVGCPCGATMWIPAYELNKFNDQLIGARPPH